jgi:hypothetical protein
MSARGEKQPYPVTVTVSLRLNGTGTPINFNATVPVASVVAIDLRSYLPSLANVVRQPGAGWGNGLMANSAWGTARIALPSGATNPNDLLAVNAEVATVSGAVGASAALSETCRLGGTSLSATVWRPNATTRIYLVLQDASGGQNTAYLSWNNGPWFRTVSLAANTAQLVELTSYVSVGAAADLEVNTSTTSPVVATFLGIDETTTMTVSQPLLAPPAGLGTLYSVPLKVSGGWGAKVAVANMSSTAGNMVATVMWYSGGFLTPTVGLSFGVPANSAVVYNLGALVNIPTGATTIVLRLDEIDDYPAHQLAATVFGMKNGALGLVTPWRMSDEAGGVQEKSAVGFFLGTGTDDTRAIIGATNVGSQSSTDVVLVVSYLDGQGQPHQYVPAPVSLDAEGGFVAYDLRQLRDSQTPDSNWNVLPANLTTGNAHLWASNGTITGFDMTWSETAGIAIQCDDKCGPRLPRYNGAIDPAPELRCFYDTPPSIQQQLYKQIGFAVDPLLPPPAGEVIIQACGGPLLTHCGSQRFLTKLPGFPWYLGFEVIFFDFQASLGFYGLDICIPVTVSALTWKPCP